MADRVLAPERSQAIVEEVLQAKGATPENARVVSDHLLISDLSGLRSHGFIRLPQYANEIDLGELEPAARPVEMRRQAARADLDAGRCFGQVSGVEAVQLVEELARGHGVGVVTVHQAGHTGRIGAYAELLGEAGFLGVVVCSGSRIGHRVAPLGGREARLATNPIAFAIPSTGDPIVGDFSTSTAPEGVIRVLHNIGAQAPPGTLLGPDGQPTTDPSVLYRQPPGTIVPLGGDRLGYRGFGLALLVEALAVLLAHDDTTDLGRTGSNLALIAMSVDEDFRARTDRLADYVLSSPPTGPDAVIMLPGAKEYKRRRETNEVIVDEVTWNALVPIAAACGVDLDP